MKSLRKACIMCFIVLFPLCKISFGQTNHDKVILPNDKGGPKYLNDAIVGDTLANGQRADPNRVYILKRDGIYLVNSVITNTGYTLTMKSENGPGWKPFIYLDNNPVSKVPPGQMVLIKADLTLKNIVMSGFFEPLAENLGGLQGALFNTGSAGVNIVIDSCILNNVNGNHIRTDQAPHLVKVTNTIFANMGYLGRSNLGAGKGLDVRSGSVDSLIVQNCTFVNWQDRVIRHFSSTAPIKYLLFDHNTLVNGMSYHGLLSLGKVGYQVNITNNLLCDAFALGNDSDYVRQAEFTDSGEKDKWGGARMTWVITSPNDTTKYTIKNNYYCISAEGQAFFDKYKAAGISEGTPLTWFVNKKLGADSTKAFIKLATPIALKNVPKLMTKFMEWYRDPAGANKTKSTTNWKTDFDYDRRSSDYYYDSLNCSYPTTSPAFTGSTTGGPVGALTWSSATGVDRISNTIVSNYSLEQNYPNPFNPSTNIVFNLPKESKISVVIYNSLGQEIKRLVNNQQMNSGRFNVIWNGRDSFGKVVSSGIYFYQLISNDVMISRKMQLLK
ncbi:MAG: T9SS type A sorting domain-containing protein [Bacteroidota bacterium]|nr:T9SS type A sorting domain-containing protein [Bacteroidota bacterium]MDP4190527.1 T9SS type A sorting domain-containing protein [Bacteroidota bacterium]MDP4193670.1 T9SS type A sorting domain-containing protein [Bacteroidota bacterium]